MIIGANVRQSAMTAHNLGDRARLEAAADAGIYLALERLLLARTHDVDPVGAWACRYHDARLFIQIRDEGERLDLNAISVDLLAALLEEIGVDALDARSVAAATLDYRDRDDEPRESGAEASAYAEAGRALMPKNSGFDSLDELGRVLGVTPELVDALRPILTVHKQQPGIDPEIALPLARAAMERMMQQPLDRELTASEASQLYFRALYLPSNRSVYRLRVDAEADAGAAYAQENVIGLDDEAAFGYRRLAEFAAESGAISSPGGLEPCSVDQSVRWIRSKQPDFDIAEG